MHNINSKIARFGVSVAQELLVRFDRVINQQDYPTRSKAIEDLMRNAIMHNELSHDAAVVVGSIDIVYDHHKRELLNKLIDVQHNFGDIILSSQHIHLGHHACFEIVVVKGEKKRVEKLSFLIKSIKGVKHGSLRLITLGE